MRKKKKKNIEFIDDRQERKELAIGSVRDLLDGSFLNEFVVKQIPYILFITLLAFVYIGNRYRTEKIVRKTIDLQKELSELRAEAITTSSELMFISKQSEVVKMVEEQGLELKESVEPPMKIVITDE